MSRRDLAVSQVQIPPQWCVSQTGADLQPTTELLWGRTESQPLGAVTLLPCTAEVITGQGSRKISWYWSFLLLYKVQESRVAEPSSFFFLLEEFYKNPPALLTASTVCSPNLRCKSCWRWGCSDAGKVVVCSGQCKHGRDGSWPAPALWADCTSTAPQTGHRRPLQNRPSVSETPSTSDQLSPKHFPELDSLKSSTRHSPCLL